MSAPPATRALRQVIARAMPRQTGLRYAALRLSGTPPRATATAAATSTQAVHMSPSRSNLFSTSTAHRAGMMPDTPDPQPPNNEPHERAPQPAVLDDDAYHELADVIMDRMHEKAEGLQESREDVEVEYSAGVLSITFPPNGTYIINKQPPNKQIWLSSPVSGPKRYDWVVAGEGMHQKEGTGEGEWIYVRDGSRLTDLLRKELGLSVDDTTENMQQSTDPTE